MFGMGERSVKTGQLFWEPTYKEKLMVLNEVGIWKKVALEVMPPQREVVDRANVYHLFEFEDLNNFVYNIAPIFQAPKLTRVSEDGKVEYHLSIEHAVQYLYLRDTSGEELTWWKKQKLKNQLIGTHRCAVEIIIKGMESKDYTVLICLPNGRTMDFTLI